MKRTTIHRRPTRAWQPTHQSAFDGSEARLVEYRLDGLSLWENENGDRWWEHLSFWNEMVG